MSGLMSLLKIFILVPFSLCCSIMNYSLYFKVTVWCFSSSIFDILFRILRRHRISIRKRSKTFFVGSRAKKPAKNPEKRDQMAFSYRYSVSSQYSEQNIKNWKKTYCHFKPIYEQFISAQYMFIGRCFCIFLTNKLSTSLSIHQFILRRTHTLLYLKGI